jgi:hypothetical protein
MEINKEERMLEAPRVETIAVNVEDLEIFRVKLSTGKYLIDGEVVEIGYSSNVIELKSIDDIRVIIEGQVPNGKVDKDENTITDEEWTATNNKLTSKGEWREDLENYSFEDIDDEVAYLRFRRTWKQSYKFVQNISDPIKVTVEKTVYDTGNEFIKSCLSIGKSSKLFTYNRVQAHKSLLKDAMGRLGVPYGDRTNNNGARYTNSSHSGIRYAQFCNNYLFSDDMKGSDSSTGTLEDVAKWYNSDKRKIESTIKLAYNKKFGKVSIEDSKDHLIEIIKTLSSISSSAKQIRSTVKSTVKPSSVGRSLDVVVAKLDQLFE